MELFTHGQLDFPCYGSLLFGALLIRIEVKHLSTSMSINSKMHKKSLTMQITFKNWFKMIWKRQSQDNSSMVILNSTTRLVLSLVALSNELNSLTAFGKKLRKLKMQSNQATLLDQRSISAINSATKWLANSSKQAFLSSLRIFPFVLLIQFSWWKSLSLNSMLLMKSKMQKTSSVHLTNDSCYITFVDKSNVKSLKSAIRKVKITANKEI